MAKSMNDILPLELIRKILVSIDEVENFWLWGKNRFLPRRSYCTTALVCRRWKEISNQLIMRVIDLRSVCQGSRDPEMREAKMEACLAALDRDENGASSVWTLRFLGDSNDQKDLPLEFGQAVIDRCTNLRSLLWWDVIGVEHPRFRFPALPFLQNLSVTNSSRFRPFYLSTLLPNLGSSSGSLHVARLRGTLRFDLPMAALFSSLSYLYVGHNDVPSEIIETIGSDLTTLRNFYLALKNTPVNFVTRFTAQATSLHVTHLRLECLHELAWSGLADVTNLLAKALLDLRVTVTESVQQQRLMVPFGHLPRLKTFMFDFSEGKHNMNDKCRLFKMFPLISKSLELRKLHLISMSFGTELAKGYHPLEHLQEVTLWHCSFVDEFFLSFLPSTPLRSLVLKTNAGEDSPATARKCRDAIEQLVNRQLIPHIFDLGVVFPSPTSTITKIVCSVTNQLTHFPELKLRLSDSATWYEPEMYDILKSTTSRTEHLVIDLSEYSWCGKPVSDTDTFLDTISMTFEEATEAIMPCLKTLTVYGPSGVWRRESESVIRLRNALADRGIKFGRYLEQ
ncbi:hypothetical protein BT69DRAFT_1350424 [Atractiella rhizophila]|nr:hypothetical protein BT69DRAFT_1350424 [Atractiella rhizophila]